MGVCRPLSKLIVHLLQLLILQQSFFDKSSHWFTGLRKALNSNLKTASLFLSFAKLPLVIFDYGYLYK
jgi:hypothetical protein